MNAVVSVIIVATIIPVGLAARLAGSGSVTRTARAEPAGKADG